MVNRKGRLRRASQPTESQPIKELLIMTNEIICKNDSDINYESLSNEEFLMLLKSFNVKIDILTITLKRHYPEALNELCNRTDFLNEHFRSKSKHVPIKSRLYCLEHNIVSHPICSNPKCDKIHNTVGWDAHRGEFKRYCCVKCMASDQKVKEQRKKTNIELRGVEYPTQCKDVQEKAKNTNLKIRGVEFPVQCEEVRTKMRNTNIERRGVPYPTQSLEVLKKCSETSYNHYGVSHPMKSNQVKKTLEERCFAKYGVTNFSKSPLFSSYCRKKIFHDNLYFDSNWEVIVYDYCKYHHFDFKYQPNTLFEYSYNGKFHTYHPDFMVNGLLYEVKGDQFFRINESTGKEEMYCPWRRKEWSDEKYNDECGKLEAKHQCMVKNKITIIRHEELHNLDCVFGK